MTRLRAVSLELVFALGFASTASATACSSTDTGSGSDETAAERACLDTVEALSRLAERCGKDYRRSYDVNLETLANGDCKNVLSIRNEEALRATCLPSIQAESCVDFLAGTIAPECSQQLERQKTR